MGRPEAPEKPSEKFGDVWLACCSAASHAETQKSWHEGRTPSVPSGTAREQQCHRQTPYDIPLSRMIFIQNILGAQSIPLLLHRFFDSKCSVNLCPANWTGNGKVAGQKQRSKSSHDGRWDQQTNPEASAEWAQSPVNTTFHGRRRTCPAVQQTIPIGPSAIIIIHHDRVPRAYPSHCHWSNLIQWHIPMTVKISAAPAAMVFAIIATIDETPSGLQTMSCLMRTAGVLSICPFPPLQSADPHPMLAQLNPCVSRWYHSNCRITSLVS